MKALIIADPSHCLVQCQQCSLLPSQSFLVAVVIPEKKEVQSFAKQQGISGDYSDILKNDQVSSKGLCQHCQAHMSLNDACWVHANMLAVLV